jgi:hypothetical protein
VIGLSTWLEPSQTKRNYRARPRSRHHSHDRDIRESCILTSKQFCGVVALISRQCELRHRYAIGDCSCCNKGYPSILDSRTITHRLRQPFCVHLLIGITKTGVVGRRGPTDFVSWRSLNRLTAPVRLVAHTLPLRGCFLATLVAVMAGTCAFKCRLHPLSSCLHLSACFSSPSPLMFLLAFLPI